MSVARQTVPVRPSLYDPRRQRFDYFLIWGNGLAHFEDVRRMIREQPYLEIMRIQKHRPQSIAHFVRQVYSYDYAPFSISERKRNIYWPPSQRCWFYSCAIWRHRKRITVRVISAI